MFDYIYQVVKLKMTKLRKYVQKLKMTKCELLIGLLQTKTGTSPKVYGPINKDPMQCNIYCAKHI